MAEILRGKPVAEAITEKTIAETEALKAQGIYPTLCILRVGERPDDISYERAAIKRCGKMGVDVKTVVLPENVEQKAFDKALMALNKDETVHGILLFFPLPAQLSDDRARKLLSPDKDIDGCTDISEAGVFANKHQGFPPCTAQAIMEIIKYYEVPVYGKTATVIGRSLVVGRPVSMMLMHENATVTTCHTKTPNTAEVARRADILVTACGQLGLVTSEFTNPDQTVIDVGTNWDNERGVFVGDVNFDDVEPNCKAISPVPGGVGAVTTCLLISHVVEAAKRASVSDVSE